jgi:DNA-binding NarL/FixJ family response regulator
MAASSARVIILTGVTDVAMHQKAVRLGAAGLILKDQASEVLIRAIERVHLGESWFDRNLMANALAEMAQMQVSARLTGQGVDQLSERERDVISLVCEGLQNKHIANRLGISETTVRHHLTSSFSKLDVADRLELAIFAFRNGLCKLEA